MSALLIIALCSFGAGIGLMVPARMLARHIGLIDVPDGWRKLQRGPIPLAGGIVVFFSASIALGIAALTDESLAATLFREPAFPGLFLAALVICAVGLADDLRLVRGRHKLFGQLAAVGIVMSTGVVVRSVQLFGLTLELGPLAFPLTALWLLGAINALNLLDGMDGMLGCVGTIIALALTAMAVAAGQWWAAAVAAALAGALVAFLCFNLPPASVFLGDCGSMLVGLVIGVLAIPCSLKGPATVALAAPLALLTVPFFDTVAAIVRRKLTGRSIYSTDRGHIHHTLQRRGLSNASVLLVVSGLCALTVGGMLASVAFNNELMALIAALTVINILVVGRLFGHAECMLLNQRLVGLWVRLTQGPTHQLEVRLQGSADWTDLWATLREHARALGLRSVRLNVNAPAVQEGYHARWDRFDAAEETPLVWQVELPLMVNGQAISRLQLTGDRNTGRISDIMQPILRLVAEVEQLLAVLVTNATVPPPGTDTADLPDELPKPVRRIVNIGDRGALNPP